MDKKTLFILIIIIILAFLLRFYRVTEIPPSLNWDEISISYNAYSVIKTGKDEWGELLPTHFKAYGEYKLPAQVYASIPGIAIFGLNELGVRITPVIYGTLTVLFIFYLGRRVFKNNAIGLVSAFLVAISPWHIQLTRASFESSFALFWIVIGVWFFLKGFETSKWWIWSTIPLGISVYTYNSARFFTPAFFIFLLMIFRKELFKLKKYAFLTILFFILLMLPLIPYYLSGEGNARYKLVSVTDDAGLIPRIEERRNNSTLLDPLIRLIHNRYTYIFATVTVNYFSHFSPDFLFISGAPHKQHHVQNIGQLYLFQAPFLLLGLIYLFKVKNQFRWLLMGWLFIALVPVAFTQDSIPHALRTLIAIPIYQLLSASGLILGYRILQEKKHLWAVLIFIVIILIAMWQFGNYLNNYYNIYPKLYSKDWQFGYKQAVNYIKKNYQQYDQIVFTRHYGEPHMFVLFYLNFDPYKYQNDPKLVRFETYDWVRVLNFDKFYFPDLGDKGTQFKDIINSNPNKKILFIGRPGDFPSEHLRLERINFLDNTPVFDIVEVK